MHNGTEQIDRLARECVRQVKERGPFLNLSEFVNRRLAGDETGVRELDRDLLPAREADR